MRLLSSKAGENPVPLSNTASSATLATRVSLMGGWQTEPDWDGVIGGRGSEGAGERHGGDRALDMVPEGLTRTGLMRLRFDAGPDTISKSRMPMEKTSEALLMIPSFCRGTYQAWR